MSDMGKTEYLLRQFSNRTRGKDFENYVVNAIWNRVGDGEVLPVTQQFAQTVNGPAFIDLYFPQIGVAIECDEPYHEDPKQRQKDLEREVSVFDALTAIDSSALAGGFFRVRQEAFRDNEDLEAELDALAHMIGDLVEQQRLAGTFEPWTHARPDPGPYFRSRKWIDVEGCARDRVGFRTIAEIHNALFGTKHDISKAGQGLGSFYRLARYDPSYGELHLSIANLSVDVDNGERWTNTLSADGKELRETPRHLSEDEGQPPPGETRVWFVRDQREILGSEPWLYRFAGVYRWSGTESGTRVWTRVGTRMRLAADGAPLDPSSAVFE